MDDTLIERLIRLKDVTSEQKIRDLLSEACNALVKANQAAASTLPASMFEADPVAMAHSFDGYGWSYIDNGYGSQWMERGERYKDHVLLYRKDESNG